MARRWCGARSARVMRCLGPKLLNRCRPEKKDTKENGKIFENNPQAWRMRGARRKRERKVEGWKKKRHKERVQEGRWEILECHDAKTVVAYRHEENVGRDRRALLKKEGNLIRDNKATQEDNFLSCWLREMIKRVKPKKVEEIDKKGSLGRK